MILHPIGRLHTPFRTLAECPRNGRQLHPAPECVAEISAAFHEGMAGIETFSHLVLLYWLGPQSASLTIVPPFDGTPRGVFATRSPARPNPVGMAVVSLHGVEAGGRLLVRNLDCLDGTPLLDVKPYLASTDAEPTADMGWLAPHRTARLH